MGKDGPFFPDFEMFVEFYGSATYVDDWWLQAVFSGGFAYLTNGNADFGGYGDDSRIGKPG